MTPSGTAITNVIFDAAAGRFLATVRTAGKTLTVSAPGHVTWPHGRIARALSEAAARLQRRPA